MRRNHRTALTLVETLIVITIVAILAGAVIPIAGTSSQDAKDVSLGYNEAELQKIIDVYKFEHDWQTPEVKDGGLPQLFAATNRFGQIGDKGPDYPFGPYAPSHEMPTNPRTDRNTVTEILSETPPSVGLGGGWVYHKATGRIWADGLNNKTVDRDKPLLRR
jgi:type II secretory pathway pseudopilin PulG